MKLIHLFHFIVAIKWSFGQIDLLFCLETFYSLKNKRDIAPFLITSRAIFFFTVSITDAVQCGIFNAISKKHTHYSQLVKRIIAIEAQLYFLGLVGL